MGFYGDKVELTLLHDRAGAHNGNSASSKRRQEGLYLGQAKRGS